jgi:hypothetical protein
MLEARSYDPTTLRRARQHGIISRLHLNRLRLTLVADTMKPVALLGYLVRLRKPQVAHLWTGNDTACSMVSTGGLNAAKYTVLQQTTLPLCSMCSNSSLARAVLSKAEDAAE